MAAMLVDRNNKIFLLWEFTATFTANFVNKFSFFCFVLSTNMVAVKTTYFTDTDVDVEISFISSFIC